MTASERGLSSLTFHNGMEDFFQWFEKKYQRSVEPDDSRFSTITAQMNQYFSGERHEFDVPLDLTGSPFQMRVWRMLLQIPYGETVNYGTLAKRLGGPQYSRAVGLANSKNPVSIIVPCHRVIGSNGHLTGYAGGLDVKRWLLTHERNTLLS